MKIISNFRKFNHPNLTSFEFHTKKGIINTKQDSLTLNL